MHIPVTDLATPHRGRIAAASPHRRVVASSHSVDVWADGGQYRIMSCSSS